MRKKGDKMGKKSHFKKERWWGERERETKIAIENVETEKASTELSLLSTAVHAAVFLKLFLPMIIRLRHILSHFKIKHSLLFAAMMGNRVVMVFLV